MKVIIKFANTSTDYEAFLNYVDEKDFAGFNFKEVPKRLEKVFKFIKEAASKSKLKIAEWIELIKNKEIFEFFKQCAWSIKKVYDLIHEAYSGTVKKILGLINEYLEKTPVGKWTNAELKKLDEWLRKNPKIKKIGGIALVAFLIYMNLNVTYIGDFEFDFDFSVVGDCLNGNYNLADILGGAAGTSLLVLFVTNAAGLSFPWNTPIKLVGILGNCLYSLIKK